MPEDFLGVLASVGKSGVLTQGVSHTGSRPHVALHTGSSY